MTWQAFPPTQIHRRYLVVRPAALSARYKKVSNNIELLRLTRALWTVTLGRRPKTL